jgi:hypothetical protein
MLSHIFEHDGVTYVVVFKSADGQWHAAMGRHGERFGRPLKAFTEQEVGRFPDFAIRAGYIGMAEWLVKSGTWSASPHHCEEPGQRPMVLFAA